MNDQLDALVEKYKISDYETRKIFEKFILPELKYLTPSGAFKKVLKELHSYHNENYRQAKNIQKHAKNVQKYLPF